MKKTLALVAAIVLSAALAAPAAAARPTPKTLEVNPSAPVVGSSVTFSGCGYEPGVGVSVVVAGPTATTFMGALAGSDGCFSTENTSAFPVNDIGDYTASAFQSNRHKADARITFTVLPL